MRKEGDRGEEMAGRVLQRAGYFILSNNYCVRGGEIDIVARAPDGVVVFVEVKLRAREPEDHRSVVSFKKLTRIRLAAQHYLLAYGSAKIRFDLILLVSDTAAQKAHVFWYKDVH